MRFGAQPLIFIELAHRNRSGGSLTTNRRRFLESAAANAAALAIMPTAAFAAAQRNTPFAAASTDDWDLSWTERLKGKRAGVFDCTEPESGYGVWRAAAWKRQNMDVVKIAPADIVPVIVLRHNAIILAMQQSFWDKYHTGADKKVTHPMTGAPTDKNPALLDERDGLPAPFNTAAIQKQLAAGAVVLACNLALDDLVNEISTKDKVAEDEARKRAIAYLIPGVILQPSGVFAAIHAQEAGANYVKAS